MKVFTWIGRERSESRSRLLNFAWPLVAGVSKRSCGLKTTKHAPGTDDILSLVLRMFRLHPTERLDASDKQECALNDTFSTRSDFGLFGPRSIPRPSKNRCRPGSLARYPRLLGYPQNMRYTNFAGRYQRRPSKHSCLREI